MSREARQRARRLGVGRPCHSARARSRARWIVGALRATAAVLGESVPSGFWSCRCARGSCPSGDRHAPTGAFPGHRRVVTPARSGCSTACGGSGAHQSSRSFLTSRSDGWRDDRGHQLRELLGRQVRLARDVASSELGDDLGDHPWNAPRVSALVSAPRSTTNSLWIECVCAPSSSRCLM